MSGLLSPLHVVLPLVLDKCTTPGVRDQRGAHFLCPSDSPERARPETKTEAHRGRAERGWPALFFSDFVLPGRGRSVYDEDARRWHPPAVTRHLRGLSVDRA